jgi:hypothetical protein
MLKSFAAKWLAGQYALKFLAKGYASVCMRFGAAKQYVQVASMPLCLLIWQLTRTIM